jgi:hypothetical protein
MSALMLNFNKATAQADSIPTYSSFGIFDKVTDRFGQDLSWSDLKINPSTAASRFILNEGIFELHFFPGSGFEEASNSIHINRRAVIEELFNMANSIWGAQLSNEKIVVRFLPMPQSIAFGQDYPLLASSYYIVPKFTANFSEASDCVIAQYIQSADNPYHTLGDFNTKLQIASNDLQLSHLDFYCNLNNYNVNTNLQTATIATNQIDLYSVALRELLVGLGVNSLLNQTGQSISANTHQFSRWDTQLQFQSQSLITYNSAQKKYIPSALNSWLSNLPAPTANCVSLYTCAQSPYFIDGTKSIALSHCYKQGLEFNYLNEACSTNPVVLNRSWMSGTVRRKLSSSDLSVLQSLGYSLNGCFGSTSNHNDFCAQVAGSNKFTRYTSPIPNQTFLGIIEANSTQKISINALIQSNPSITSIEYIDHIGGPSVFSLSSDSISVANFQKGRNVLRFLLTNNQGDKLNAFALLALRGGEVCEGGVCNLVSNNGFEDLTGLQQCGWFDLTPPFNNGIPYVNVDCWSPFTGTPDIYSINCTNQNYDFTNGPVADDLGGNIPWDAQVQTNVIRLRTNINALEEAIQTELSTPLMPGVTYEISMRIFRRAGNDPLLNIYFRDGEYLGPATQIGNPALLNLISGPSESIDASWENQWQEWSGIFEVPMNNPNLDHIVIANENQGQPTLNASRQLFIDNVRVRPLNALFDIPQDFICEGSIVSLQEFGTPNGGVVSGPGVTTPNFTFNSSLVSPGTYTLNYTITDDIGCILSASDIITVQPVVTFPNTNVTAACTNNCSGAISVAPVVSAEASVVYTWTGPGINAGNQNALSLTNLCAGSYTITAFVNGLCSYSQTYIVTSNPHPIVSSSIDYDLCATTCNGSILVTSSIPNSTISWTGGLTGFNPTGVCAGTYSATVTGPNLCPAEAIQVTIVSQPLQTLNVNTSSTWNTNNEYDNITLGTNALLTLSGNTSVHTINGTITVNNGTGLFISGTNVRFGPSGRIIVQPGGRVLLQQATLTANCPNIYWRGIEVRGSVAYSQNDISLSSNLTVVANNNDGFTNQGGIWIDKSSLIEYADIAVKLYQGTIDTDNNANTLTTNSGGFIRADESTFRNNRRDIAFSTYGSANYPNLSSFRRCTFDVNTNHFTSGDILRERVLIRQTYNVLFVGCTWINSSPAIANNNNSQASSTNTNTLDDQSALRLISGHCILNQFVSGSTIIPCRFLGFIYGINSSGSYLSKALIVNNAVFRCYRSVRASSLASGSEFNKCDFGAINSLPSPITIAIPPTFINSPATTPWVNNSINNNGNPTTWLNGPAYGIYLNTPGATTIQNNNFSILGATSNQRVGLYVNGGGANRINVVDNRFRGNTYGIRFFNTNRNSGAPSINGTTIRCNEFSNNDLHVEINAHNVTSTSAGINQDIWNVSLNQSFSNEFDAYQSPITSLPVGRNIWDNVMPYHHFRGRPDEVSGNTTRISGIGGSGSILAQYSANFPPNPECGATNMGMIVNELLTDFESKKTALENYKDDGSPEYYQYLVESMNSSNIVQRFNELSGASPSLSVDRIIEILNKESELPRSMLMNILMSNISSLKNGESLSKLDSLQTPLTSWEKESLFDLFSNIDAKGVLESQVNEAAFKLYNASSEELTSVLLDSLVINKTPAIEDFNSKLNIISSGHNELMNAQNDLNYSLMISIINNRLQNLRESSMESKDLIKLKELIEETMSYGTTDSIMQLNYDGFASNYIIPELPMTYRMADLIINKFDPSGYHGDLEYPFGLPNTRSFFKPNQKEIIYAIKSFPNPANSYVQIQSQGEDISNSVMIVRDLTGREIPVEILTKSKNEWVIDVNEWVNGSYIIELLKEEKIIYTDKLLIQR